MKRVSLVVMCLVITSLLVAGCGSGVSETKPIAEVKQEAQTMDASQLKSIVEKYKAAIEAKKPELQALQAELKKIPITQMMGDDAGAIKKEIEAVTASIRALTSRLSVYSAELRKK